MDKLELSIIIPCFNEEQNVKKFYDKVKTIMGGGSLKFQNIYFIFIDDGSTDNTETEILNLKQSNSNIKYIKFSRNFGKESAMLAGLKASKTILTCIMDCDLQDPPELLLEMIDKYKRSNGDLKMITAKRKNRSGDSKIRAIFSEGFYKINNLISPIKLESGVRILGKSIIESSHIKANTTISDSIINHSDIGPNAHIRPKCAISHSHIGNFVECKSANLLNIKAGHLSYLGDCEIGSGTNVGAGVITCNYDGKTKHKTRIGKNVFIGSDTQIIAPAIIEDNSIIAAGSTITSRVESGSLAISRIKQVNIKGWFYKFFGK